MALQEDLMKLDDEEEESAMARLDMAAMQRRERRRGRREAMFDKKSQCNAMCVTTRLRLGLGVHL